MSTITYSEILEKAVAASRAGAEVLRRYFTSGEPLEVGLKGEHDFVTRADKESEAAILAEIRRHFPQHHILAEESGRSEQGDGDYQWLVDPLDGTTNFLQGLPVFCVSVACRKGEDVVAGVVLDPVLDILFTASLGGGAFQDAQPMRVSERPGVDGAFLATGYPWRAKAALSNYLGAFQDLFLQARSIRRCGAAALDLAYTAAGVYDGFFEFRLSPWDIAAGVLLVREAGGRVTDLDGREGFPRGGNVIAAGSALHKELLAAVRGHADEATLDRLVPLRSDADPAGASTLADPLAAGGRT